MWLAQRSTSMTQPKIGCSQCSDTRPTGFLRLFHTGGIGTYALCTACQAHPVLSGVPAVRDLPGDLLQLEQTLRPLVPATCKSAASVTATLPMTTRKIVTMTACSDMLRGALRVLCHTCCQPRHCRHSGWPLQPGAASASSVQQQAPLIFEPLQMLRLLTSARGSHQSRLVQYQTAHHRTETCALQPLRVL